MSTLPKALLLVLLVASLRHPESSSNFVSRDRAELVKVVGRCRLLEGRLTGGFQYASYRTPITPVARQSLVAMGIRMATLKSREARLSLVDRVVLGLFSSLDVASLDWSIELLQREANLRSGKAAILSDLSALLIARGVLRQNAHDFVLAVDASSGAIDENSRLAEAHFNRALALEHLFLEIEACQAWDDYLRLDYKSDWAEEARSRCRRSRPTPVGWLAARPQLDSAAIDGNQDQVERIINRFPQSARMYAEKELLGSWAVSALENRDLDASRFLRIAHSVGMVLQEAGDHLVSEATAEILEAHNSREYDKYNALIHGHHAYLKGLKFADRDLDEQALAHFEAAAEYFAEARSPFFYRANLKSASCLYYLGRYDYSIQRLQSLSARVDKTQYPSLAAESLWIQGLAYSKLANFSAAYQLYKEASEIFLVSQEQENVAFLDFLMAENLRYQGQPDKAWECLHRALRTVKTMGYSLWYHNSLFDSAELALNEGRPRVAIFFQNEMVKGGAVRRDSILMAESLLRRARTHHRMGNPNLAMADLAEALAWSEKIESRVRRAFLQADISMVSSEVQLAEGNVSLAVEFLDGAIEEAKRHGRLFRLPDLYEARGNAFIQGGDEQRAEADFRSAIDELSRQRNRLLGWELRVSHFERAQRIFNSLILLKVRQGEAGAAFGLAEEARGRALLDSLDSIEKIEQGHASTLDYNSIRERLPIGTVLVEYCVLKDRLVVFMVSRYSLRMVEVAEGRDALEAKVEDYMSSLYRREEASRQRLAKELYNLLIAPTYDFDRRDSVLVVIPDKFLSLVPYSSLVNPRSGEYLIEERAVVLAPSANAFVGLSSRKLALQKRAGRVDRFLVIGDPRFDHEQLPTLVGLRGAGLEADTLARVGGADLLGGTSATPAALTKVLSFYAIIHIAAHLRPNLQDPLNSALILAPEEDDASAESGLLRVRDIYNLHLPNTRLVIVAACGGAAGKVLDGEGFGSLASAFLAKGIPTVVASLWEVEDDIGASLFIEFHKNLRSGMGAPEALRDVQLNFLSSEDRSKRDPYLWAGIHVMGAS